MPTNAMMDFCEEMLRAVIFKVVGHTHVPYGSHSIDFAAVPARGDEGKSRRAGRS